MRNFLTHRLSGKSLHMNNGFIVKSCIFWFKVQEKKVALLVPCIWDVECILYMFKHYHHSRWPDKHVVRQIRATATLFVRYCITKACLFRNNRSFMMKFGGIISIGVGLFLCVMWPCFNMYRLEIFEKEVARRLGEDSWVDRSRCGPLHPLLNTSFTTLLV